MIDKTTSRVIVGLLVTAGVLGDRGDERVQISGLVRPIDIGPDNRVLSTRVANATIRYVGKGEIARASKQGWLQRFFSIISPF